MYKAFVSSTFKDLSGHRTEVIRALSASGFHVDPMENWQADRDAPRHFSSDRLDGCKICILIVAFRRGHVPEGEMRSITQIEYAAAQKRKIDVLPFLLADATPVGGDMGWNPLYDERATDPEVERWRKTLRESHGVGEFGTDPKSLRVDAAVSRWVVKTESDRALRFRRIVTGILLGTLCLVLAAIGWVRHIYQTPELRSTYHSGFLAFHDPQVYYNSPTGKYEFGRVLDSYSTLVKETVFAEEILATKSSLDLLVNNASYTRHSQRENFIKIVENGANLRIILWDYTEANRPSYDAFHHAIRQNPEGPRGEAENVHRELAEWKRQIDTDRVKYKGTFEYRWNSSPLLHTLWIRDWDTENALGHLSVHFYRGQEFWPSFRVSPRDGKRLLENIHQEFEEAWRRSKILPTPP